MSQHDGVIADQDGAAFLADLNAFIAAYLSRFSGTSDPAALVAYQKFIRTDLGVAFRRNAANSGNLLDGTLAETLVVAKSGAFTAGLADYQRTFICTGTWSMAFAAAATLRDGWYCAIKNDGAGVITLNPDGAETIDGVATLDIAAGQSCMVCCDGAELYVVGVLGVSQTAADARVQLQSATAFTTAGTATAFTLTTANAPALTTGERWFVTFNAASGATPTLNRDSKGAKSLKYRDSAGAKQAITATQVPSGWSSDVVYDGTDYVVLEVVRNHAPDFVSSEQATTVGTLTTIAHGLGVRPSDWKVRAICKTAEAGWAVGDIIDINLNACDVQNATNIGTTAHVDETNIYIHTAPSYFAIAVHKSAGSGNTALTPANWKFIAYVWR